MSKKCDVEKMRCILSKMSKSDLVEIKNSKEGDRKARFSCNDHLCRKLSRNKFPVFDDKLFILIVKNTNDIQRKIEKNRSTIGKLQIIETIIII